MNHTFCNNSRTDINISVGVTQLQVHQKVKNILIMLNLQINNQSLSHIQRAI